MSAAEYTESIWSDPENSDSAPRICPICEQVLAHADNLRDNDDIPANGLFSAYRLHRQAHYEWGEDPTQYGKKPGDPFLGHYYDNDANALWEPEDDDQPPGDPDEVVGNVYDVTLSYELQVRARVVAPDDHRAKEKVRYRELPEDVSVTEERTHLMHKDARQVKKVTRADTDLAERMEGWPW